MVRVKESSLKSVAALGGGLLIGTSLAVVIPEGFHALAGGEAHSHDHSGGEQYAGLALVGGFLGMLVLDHLQHAIGATHLHSDTRPQQHGVGCSHNTHGNSGHAGHTHSSGLAAASSEGAEHTFETADLEQHLEQQSLLSYDIPEGSSPQRAITGLLIHCAADGLAMGAAALSGDLGLSLMISVAMVVHKAPMAFGLATYLMKHKWPWARAQPTMVLFSAMAPIGATITYLLLGNIPVFTSQGAIALIVLFSGGTFLYAATMHILPEVLGGGCHLTLNQIAALTVGGVLPAVLAFGHTH